MGQAFASLREEQKKTFRERVARYGLDPDKVVQEGVGGTVWDVVTLEEVRELFGLEGGVMPPPPDGEKTPARMAQDHVFGYRSLVDKELDFLDRNLGPYRINVAVAPDLTITREKPLVLEGGVEIREYGAITIEDGGQIVIRDCVAKITCQRLEKK